MAKTPDKQTWVTISQYFSMQLYQNLSIDIYRLVMVGWKSLSKLYVQDKNLKWVIPKENEVEFETCKKILYNQLNIATKRYHAERVNPKFLSSDNYFKIYYRYYKNDKDGNLVIEWEKYIDIFSEYLHTPYTDEISTTFSSDALNINYNIHGGYRKIWLELMVMFNSKHVASIVHMLTGSNCDMAFSKEKLSTYLNIDGKYKNIASIKRLLNYVKDELKTLEDQEGNNLGIDLVWYHGKGREFEKIREELHLKGSKNFQFHGKNFFLHLVGADKLKIPKGNQSAAMAAQEEEDSDFSKVERLLTQNFHMRYDTIRNGENQALIRDYLWEYGYEEFEQFVFNNIKSFNKADTNPNKKNIQNRIRTFMTNLRAEINKIKSKGRGQETPLSIPKSTDQPYKLPHGSPEESLEQMKKDYMQRFGYPMDSS